MTITRKEIGRHFNPLPRKEGDGCSGMDGSSDDGFQSTPS